QTSNGSSYEADLVSSAAGAQDGTATLASATDWYAVCAVFHLAPATPQEPPSTPAGLEATSVASTRVALAWSPSTGSVAGYTVYRDGAAIGTARPDTTIFLDPGVMPSTTYTYSVDAFDLANDHSAQSAPLTVPPPAQSPEFIQGAAASSDRVASDTLTLTEPVAAGDLLVGWFSQFDVPGEVQVSDNVNGPWTRSVSTTFSGAGDIALYYRENSAASPSGLAITVSASAPAYLQAAAADYRGVATAGALDQAVVSGGHGTNASAAPTAPLANTPTSTTTTEAPTTTTSTSTTTTQAPTTTTTTSTTSTTAATTTTSTTTTTTDPPTTTTTSTTTTEAPTTTTSTSTTTTQAPTTTTTSTTTTTPTTTTTTTSTPTTTTTTTPTNT